MAMIRCLMLAVCVLCVTLLGLAPSDEAVPHLRRLHANVYTGGQPVGHDAFAALNELGVRTIISVDGARPDVEMARRFNMRYHHIPQSYHALPIEDQIRIAEAIWRSDRAGVYVHCHHGKHRAPAAAAAALVRLERLTPDQAIESMRTAGTSGHYQGLYESVRLATPVDDETLAAAEDIPEIARVPDLVAAMAEIDRRFEHVLASRRAGWKAPTNHPDLIPAAEAARMAELFRELKERREEIGDPRSIAADDEAAASKSRHYWRLMDRAIERAASLESAMTSDAFDAATAGEALDALGAACFTCHMSFQS
ncbi:MAG: hypothetical protein AAGK04_05370 [Planctomycetota bacterium]